jgi:hypothetical protein
MRPNDWMQSKPHHAPQRDWTAAQVKLAARHEGQR